MAKLSTYVSEDTFCVIMKRIINNRSNFLENHGCEPDILDMR